MGHIILNLIIETLTKSSFDVIFENDCENHHSSSSTSPSSSISQMNTTNSNNFIDSKFFLNEMESLIKERIYQLVIPFR